VIGRVGIAALIPHAGAMCLLDEVVTWDGTRISCRSASHRDIANPLAEAGTLDAVCGIEYAAQAMAVHGALISPADGRPASGYLASVREVTCHVARLDRLAGDLDIEAEQLHAEAGRVIYRFALNSDGRALLSGRAAVVLDAQSP
jgi:predicted hotdog family 3-hydroxylacyl-ACP dehydratase